MNRGTLVDRWHTVSARVDWLVAGLLCVVGLADVFSHRLFEPRWAATLATLVVFLPIGVRRHHPLPVLVAVGGASLVLELVIGNPRSSNQFGLEVLVAWLIVAYSTGAHTSGREHRVAVAVGLAYAAIWAGVAYAIGAGDANTIPAVLLVAAVWIVGRAVRRRQVMVDQLGDHARRLEREREEKVRALVAEERSRIARELHDVVAHSVSVMVIQAQAGPRLAGDPTQTAATFKAIESSGREALVELRRLLGILRTADDQLAVGPQPGLESITALLEQVREAGLPVELRVEGEHAGLPPGLDLSAYRIIQEALTNTLKHSGPAHAQVVVRYGTAAVDLEILDDGAGAPASVNGAGHGLIGMRERAALYGGQLEAGPRPEGGYAVRAHLPMRASP